MHECLFLMNSKWKNINKDMLLTTIKIVKCLNLKQLLHWSFFLTSFKALTSISSLPSSSGLELSSLSPCPSCRWRNALWRQTRWWRCRCTRAGELSRLWWGLSRGSTRVCPGCCCWLFVAAMENVYGIKKKLNLKYFVKVFTA